MTEESAITEGIRRVLGKETEAVVWEVDKQWVKAFAEAIGDPNPLWQDERYARRTRYGGIVTPPSFLAALRVPGLSTLFADIDTPLKKQLNASSELEFYEPIRVGDTITVTVKIVDAKEGQRKQGKMLFLNYDVVYRNQLGDVVAKNRGTVLRY